MIIAHRSLDEIRHLGILQEINRQFLHPLGLAMFFSYDAKSGKFIDVGITESDDPTGFIFLNEDINEDFAQNVITRQKKMMKARMKELGYVIQPLPSESKEK